jgi:teichuronic acid biosynthesis glycosyltransferase TuaC
VKVLFLSSLYPSSVKPEQGLGNYRVLRALRAHAEVRVMAPLPWYPAPLVGRWPELAAIAAAPAVEMDAGGHPVMHPRLLHLPRVGRALYAGLYAASVLAPLRAEVRRFRPDVLMSAWAYPDGTAAVALGRALGLPVVVRVMGSDINDYAQKALRRPQIAWAMRSASRVVAVSRALGREVEKLGARADRVAVVHTGVDADRFRPRPREEARRALGLAEGPLIVVPSRLAPEKGVGHFVEAAGLLSKKGVAFRAVVLGHGPLLKELTARAARLGLADRVTFAGWQAEETMALYYAAADVACLPSLEEGWPNVLMESFAAGCPVVASEVGGVPEIIALTGSGRTVPPGNPWALADALGEALGRTWDRQGTAQAMRAWSWERTARGYLDALEVAARGEE